MKSFKKPQQFKSQYYLDWLTTQPCFVCGQTAHLYMDVVYAHQSLGYGKKGAKSHDLWALPECTMCHHLEHNHIKELKELYFANHDIAGGWQDWNDIIRMEINRHNIRFSEWLL